MYVYYKLQLKNIPPVFLKQEGYFILLYIYSPQITEWHRRLCLF